MSQKAFPNSQIFQKKLNKYPDATNKSTIKRTNTKTNKVTNKTDFYITNTEQHDFLDVTLVLQAKDPGRTYEGINWTSCH